LLLQVFYSVRSERMLMQQMRYNMLFRWFVGLAMDDAVWDHSTFSKNRDRLLDHAVVEAFFTEVMTLADKQGLLSKEHFSVDGTLIQAWASHKSFVPKDGSDKELPQGAGRNAQADWKGKRRSNDTHASTTDPDARLYKKSDNTPDLMGYLGHILIENRSGLVVGAVASHADGMAERAQALRLLERTPGRHPKTVGADKAYDTRDFVADCRTATSHRMWRATSGAGVAAHLGHQAGCQFPQLLRVEVVEIGCRIHAGQFARASAATESQLFTSL
jgi:IS5 family transposase